jgi:hypothetical protein
MGVILAAGSLWGCHLRQGAVVDAGGDAEPEPAAIPEAAASALAEPSTDAEPAQKHVSVHCATGEVTVLLQGEESCVVECKSPSDCPPAWTCDGEGPTSHGGRPGNVIHYCRSATHGKLPDGGASRPAAPDAGHAGTVDAGAAVKKVEHHDGGAKGK